MGLPKINFQDISDIIIRRNFQNLVDFFRNESPLLGFKHFEITFESAISNYKYPHNLGFLPKDVLVTSQSGTGTVTFNYDLFDATNLNLTSTGPCTVRFFAGTYQSGATQ